MKIEKLVARWHQAINDRDAITITEIVADEIEISEPNGQVFGLEQIFRWIDQSGISVREVSQYPLAPNVMVVEEAARRPDTESEAHVFSRYQSDGRLLIAIHRFSDLELAMSYE